MLIFSISAQKIVCLQNNSLTGTIPSQLSKMKYLNQLRLNNNKLSGEIPSEFSSLKNLSES